MNSYKTARAAVQARDAEQQIDAVRLREFDTFAKFSDADLHRLVHAAHRTSTSGPWPLILEQTPSDSCYILLSGEAAVYIGRDRVAVVGPGEVIGESALRRGRLRNATVTTIGRAEVLHIRAMISMCCCNRFRLCGRPWTRRSPSMCRRRSPSNPH